MKTSLLVLLAAGLVSFGPDEFDRLFDEIAPPEGELWRSIPWNTSLLDAQATAAEARKPLFIWAMDGHPLGCT